MYSVFTTLPSQQRCPNCKQFKPYTTEYFAQEGAFLRTTCKECVNSMRRANPKTKVRNHNNRSRRMNAPGFHTAADVRQIICGQTDKRGRLICWWCGKPIEGAYSEDHRIPLKKGGSNWPENIVLTHARCNLSKGAKMPWEFNGRLL